MSEKIIAYKAMDKNMMCRDKQYEVGKTYTEPEARLLPCWYARLREPAGCAALLPVEG